MESSSRRSARFGLLLFAALLGGCAETARPSHPSAVAQQSSLASLHAGDRRVGTIAYRLATQGAAICPRRMPLTGLTLHSAGQYAPILRSALGFLPERGDQVSILAVAPDSPAAAAGLRAGDALTAIGGAALPLARIGRRTSYGAVGAAYALLESESGADPLAMQVDRDGQVIAASLARREGCRSRVQLLASPRPEARAGGLLLSMTTGLLDFVRSDDELALVIAHEMAHNALDHKMLLREGSPRGILGSASPSTGQVRATERAADRLAYFLMARAGFNLEAAPGFWERLYRGPARTDSDVGTHPAVAERVRDARATIAEIESRRSSGRPLTP